MFLGAGYGLSINKNFSFSAEPYMKIPLYGVGEGSVKITSAGIMLGLQYHLNDRRNDKQPKSTPVNK
jgi:hypothetical protein